MPPAMARQRTDQPREQFDPDAYRMTVGEHLEELRLRVLLGLIGLIAAFVFCLIFAERVIIAFCRPLLDVMRRQELNPQLFFGQMTDPFVVYIKISLISAAVIASPWIFYQLWKFVAAGLYPHERKYITRYLPLSIALLISGMMLVYFIVLPMALDFLIRFGTGVRLPAGYAPAQVLVEQVPEQRTLVPILSGDPAEPLGGEIWFNTIDQRLKIRLPADPRRPDRPQGSTRILAFVSENLLAPLPTLPEYINLVILLLIVFGVSFQLPLVVLALERIGIVDLTTMREGRKYVYFALAILAAVVTPADIISMIALMIPLVILYEFGILLAQWGRQSPPEES
jgi:sec-independent protein translocase protein TatC